MTEYIKKEKVKAEFKKNFAYGQNENFAKWLERVACEIVDKIPVADVQPVKRGKWSECYTVSHHYSGICSVCGKASIRNQQSEPYEFCPHCGAKMSNE